jgi:hypothetical protein
MTPQQKRLRTIRQRYGSVREMLKRRDVRDLILGGYNGGIKKGKKGFATWKEGELSRFARSRPRDSQGKFIAAEAPTDAGSPPSTAE